MKIRIGVDESVAILGMKGTGKTTLMQRQFVPQMRPNVAVWDPLAQHHKDIAYRPASMVDRVAFDRLAGAIFTTKQPYDLIVEEAEQVIPEGQTLTPWFGQLFLMGRNYQQRVVVNIRETTLFSKKILRQFDHHVIFKLDGSAIDHVVKIVGRRHRADLEDMLGWTKDPRKGGGWFYHYHDGQLRLCDPIRV